MKPIVWILVCGSMLLKGQTPRAFEVASVRASAPDAPSLDRVPPEVADMMGFSGGPGTSDRADSTGPA
jgi:hypothetical protein